MSDKRQIVFVLTLVVLFYLVPSFFLAKNIFYLFSLVWSISIIFWVTFIEKIKTDINPRRLLILILIMVADCLLVRKLSPTIAMINVLAGIVMAPIMEELLFRGWVISKIGGSRKDKIVKSSILFGLYHFKNAFVLSPFALLYQVFYAGFIVGPIFSWVRLKYNSLFASMALHSLNNTIASTVTERFFSFIVASSRKYN